MLSSSTGSACTAAQLPSSTAVERSGSATVATTRRLLEKLGSETAKARIVLLECCTPGLVEMRRKVLSLSAVACVVASTSKNTSEHRKLSLRSLRTRGNSSSTLIAPYTALLILEARRGRAKKVHLQLKRRRKSSSSRLGRCLRCMPRQEPRNVLKTPLPSPGVLLQLLRNQKNEMSFVFIC